jgi:hypothetical protein
MRLIPALVVDVIQLRLWSPGNLRTIGPFNVHFCASTVRTIEINGRQIAEGSELFPFDHDWTTTH